MTPVLLEPPPPVALGHSDKIDALEKELGRLPQAELPVTHRFTPGLYAREIFMAAGTLLTSKIHKTEHPFVISKGSVSVWTEDGGVVHLSAPHTGITQPGTRRVLYIHEDTVWTTFHVTPETDVAKIEQAIIEPHDLPLTLNQGHA
jgi:hypothetical protein